MVNEGLSTLLSKVQPIKRLFPSSSIPLMIHLQARDPQLKRDSWLEPNYLGSQSLDEHEDFLAVILKARRVLHLAVAFCVSKDSFQMFNDAK